jgi:hypothetical protein
MHKSLGSMPRTAPKPKNEVKEKKKGRKEGREGGRKASFYFLLGSVVSDEKFVDIQIVVSL